MIKGRPLYVLLWYVTILSIKISFASANLLYCKTPAVDFGNITEGDEISRTFVVKNRSGKKVKVNRVMTTCGCVTSIKGDFILKSKESIDIPIKINSSGYGERQFKKNIMIFANDNMKKPALKLTIFGHVKGIPLEERIRVSPLEMNILNDIGLKHEILIQGPSKRKVKVSVEEPEWLDVKIKPLKQYKESIFKQWILEFSLNRPLYIATKGDLLIRTNLPRFKIIHVRVMVEPKTLLQVSPPVLFANLKPNLTWKKEIQITFLIKGYSKGHKWDELGTNPNSLSINNHKKQNIQIRPSNDSIGLQQLFINEEKQKYMITIQKPIPSPQYLNIMINDLLVHKVPIILSGLSTN